MCCLYCLMFQIFQENIIFYFRYVQENVPGDTITQITPSEHDGGYSLNYEARQNASRLNQVNI